MADQLKDTVLVNFGNNTFGNYSFGFLEEIFGKLAANKPFDGIFQSYISLENLNFSIVTEE